MSVESLSNPPGWGRLAHGADALGRTLQARLWPPFIRKRKALRDHLRKVFRHFAIDCVLDVGANRGQFYRFLRYEVGYRGLVISFEPVASLAALLKKRSAYDPHWLIFPCALGATEGTAQINVTQKLVFSSLLEPDSTHTAKFSSANAVARVETIRIDTLDRMFPRIVERYGPRRVYLKLDTQGYDLEVLRGARETLPTVAALQSELSFVPIYRGMPGWNEAIATICEQGFAMSGFFPVTMDERLYLIETDGVFVRKAGSD